jgi:Zn finger protein HypA/HybF involved in hydrogenase expression
MSLPIQAAPMYNMSIPSSGAMINFRPFLVREEKALLLAQQSDDVNVMINTLKEIIKNCVKEPINVNDLAIFDIEYIFTQIRAKSVGETVDLILSCGHCEQENNKIKISLDLTKIEIVKDPNHTPRIPLFEDVGVIMKYPNVETFRKADGNTQDIDAVMEVVVDCIESIYKGDEVFYAKEQSREEINEFIMNLTKEQFDKIEQFFVTVPQYKKELEFKCPACGAQNKTVLEGAASFF